VTSSEAIVATDDELLSAYVDGVTELSPDERRRVEARLAADPAVRADADAIAALLARARAPGLVQEPDWLALERQIREAVGPRMPLPWWRRMRWLVPIGALATITAIALVWLGRAPADRVAAPTSPAAIAIHAPAPAERAAHPQAAKPDSTAIYIDGQVVELGDVDPTAVGLDVVAPDGSIASAGGAGELDETDDAAPVEATADTELLPAADYGWLDGLDDAAMDRAERWLGKKKG
jgi:hypothetical protein